MPARSPSRSSGSSGPPRCSGTPTRSGTSRRPGSTSSSGSACPLLSVALRQRLARALALARDRRRVRLDARAGRRARRGRSPSTPSGSAAGRPRSRSSRSSRSSSRTPIPSSPRALAFAIALYTYVALFGMAAFGREHVGATRRGLRRRSSAYFARIAPLHAEDGRLRLRWPLTGLAGAERMPGTLAFVAVMLGSVLFDGYSRTTTWQNLVADVEAPYLVDQPGLGELLVTLVSLGGLLAGVLLVALAYAAACALARWAVNAPRSLVPDFLLSLVPIAFVYVVAHYFSLFVIQGQFAIPLLSDPLGRGWDLFGTADVVPNLAVLSPNDDLVRPGRRARRRARRRPRRRARPRRDDLPRQRRRAALAVPVARADGALHGRRAVGALARLIAHHPDGLTLAIELAVVVVLVAALRRDLAARATPRGSTARAASRRCASSRASAVRRSRRRAGPRRAPRRAAPPPSPSPANALPTAATATPAMIRPFPSGRRRRPSSATPTAATVPATFPTIASDPRREEAQDARPRRGSRSPRRRGRAARRSRRRSRAPRRRARPGPRRARPTRSSDPAPSSAAVSSPPKR